MKHLEYDPPKRNMAIVDTWIIWALLFGVLIMGFCIGLATGMLLVKPEIIYKEAPVQKVVSETVAIAQVEPYTPEPVYSFSDDEIYLLAQLLCGQAGTDGDGEYDFETQIAKGTLNWSEINKVLEVVMNRVLTPGIYADNVTDVVLQPGAFSVMPKNASKTPSPEVVNTIRYWCDAFNSPEYVPSVPKDHYWFYGSRGGNITRNHW